jgi:thiamine-phosphate pyrophosphorylase
MAENVARTQVVLVIPAAAGAGPSVAACAAEAARAAPVATVILELPPQDPMAAPELAPVVAAIQALGIATLIAGDASLARVVKADGVHIPASKSAAAAYREARDILGARSIVGIDAGRTRHDAMTVGEEGADYVAFGIPAHVEDRQTARARRLELIAWWSEIFEIPCIACDVETPDDARDLAEAGADFIAVHMPSTLIKSSTADMLSPFAEAITDAAPVA